MVYYTETDELDFILFRFGYMWVHINDYILLYMYIMNYSFEQYAFYYIIEYDSLFDEVSGSTQIIDMYGNFDSVFDYYYRGKWICDDRKYLDVIEIDNEI